MIYRRCLLVKTIEEMDEIIEMANRLPFEIREIEEIKERSNRCKSLIIRLKDMNIKTAGDINEKEAEDLAEIVDEAKYLGIFIPDLDLRSIQLEKYESTSKIKDIIKNPREFTFNSAKSICDDIVAKYPNHHLLNDLKYLIGQCND